MPWQRRSHAPLYTCHQTPAHNSLLWFFLLFIPIWSWSKVAERQFVKSEKIQRRLALPLCKDDTYICSVWFTFFFTPGTVRRVPGCSVCDGRRGWAHNARDAPRHVSASAVRPRVASSAVHPARNAGVHTNIPARPAPPARVSASADASAATSGQASAPVLPRRRDPFAHRILEGRGTCLRVASSGGRHRRLRQGHGCGQQRARALPAHPVHPLHG